MQLPAALFLLSFPSGVYSIGHQQTLRLPVPVMKPKERNTDKVQRKFECNWRSSTDFLIRVHSKEKHISKEFVNWVKGSLDNVHKSEGSLSDILYFAVEKDYSRDFTDSFYYNVPFHVEPNTDSSGLGLDREGLKVVQERYKGTPFYAGDLMRALSYNPPESVLGAGVSAIFWVSPWKEVVRKGILYAKHSGRWRKCFFRSFDWF